MSACLYQTMHTGSQDTLHLTMLLSQKSDRQTSLMTAFLKVWNCMRAGLPSKTPGTAPALPRPRRPNTPSPSSGNVPLAIGIALGRPSKKPLQQLEQISGGVPVAGIGSGSTSNAAASLSNLMAPSMPPRQPDAAAEGEGGTTAADWGPTDATGKAVSEDLPKSDLSEDFRMMSESGGDAASGPALRAPPAGGIRAFEVATGRVEPSRMQQLSEAAGEVSSSGVGSPSSSNDEKIPDAATSSAAAAAAVPEVPTDATGQPVSNLPTASLSEDLQMMADSAGAAATGAARVAPPAGGVRAFELATGWVAPSRLKQLEQAAGEVPAPPPAAAAAGDTSDTAAAAGGSSGGTAGLPSPVAAAKGGEAAGALEGDEESPSVAAVSAAAEPGAAFFAPGELAPAATASGASEGDATKQLKAVAGKAEQVGKVAAVKGQEAAQQLASAGGSAAEKIASGSKQVAEVAAEGGKKALAAGEVAAAALSESSKAAVAGLGEGTQAAGEAVYNISTAAGSVAAQATQAAAAAVVEGGKVAAAGAEKGTQVAGEAIYEAGTAAGAAATVTAQVLGQGAKAAVKGAEKGSKVAGEVLYDAGTAAGSAAVLAGKAVAAGSKVAADGSRVVVEGVHEGTRVTGEALYDAGTVTGDVAGKAAKVGSNWLAAAGMAAAKGADVLAIFLRRTWARKYTVLYTAWPWQTAAALATAIICCLLAQPHTSCHFEALTHGMHALRA